MARCIAQSVLMSLNTLVLCIPIYLIALLKPCPCGLKPTWTELAMSIAEHWISINNLVLNAFQTLDIEVIGLENSINVRGISSSPITRVGLTS